MNKVLIAIAAAVIVVSAATVTYFILTDDGDTGDGTITIVDGSGATITLDGPLTGVITANTNVPKAMKMLGLTDELKGLSFYSATSDTSNWDLYSPWFTGVQHMPITPNLSAEGTAVVSKYVICPVSSMTVSSVQQTAFEQLGITVIRLDCYGDSALEDLEKLTILFGQPKKVMDAYNSYLDMYNGVVDTVRAAVAASPDTSAETFLYYMSSASSFYNQTAEGSLMIESIYGMNALRNISGLLRTGVTNSATETGIREVIIAEDSSNAIEKIFVRGSTTTSTPTAAGTIWAGTALVTNSYTLSAITAEEVYVLHSNMMSGMFSFIGYVAIAEICGISTGLHIADLINDYNTMYGFTESTSGYVFKMSGGSFTEIVI